MVRDALGHSLSGATPVAARHYDRAVRAFYLGCGDALGELEMAIEAALRGGLRDMAVALAHERLALRPRSAVNRAFLQRAETLTV